MKTLNLDQVNHYILKKHHLTINSKIDDIVQIASDLCGLHATGIKEQYLQIYARTNNFKKQDYEKILYSDKELGRIRCMRKTLFIHTKEMIPVAFKATFSITNREFEKYFDLDIITRKEFDELSIKIIKLLKNEEKSTSDIKEVLEIPEGSLINVSIILNLMCNRGLIIRSRPVKGWKDKRNNYVVFKEFFSEIDLNKYEENEAIIILVKKYIRSYGPVTVKDIVWWTGLTKRKIKQTLIDIEEEVGIEKIMISDITHEFFILSSDIEEVKKLKPFKNPLINFLPNMDPYLIGYKDRERFIKSENYYYAFDRSGNVTSTIIFNGKIIGTWDITEKPESIVKIHLFNKTDEETKNKILSNAQKLGQFFFGKQVQINICEKMEPLTNRSVVNFMSPLKNC